MLEILLVDDEPSILRALDDALCAEGYHVVTAFDGLSAQTALASRVFDVIVCDVRLPKVDGIALFRKARREFPGTECILMTAYATVSDAVAALKEGAVDYLAKPFDSEELLALLSRIDRERELRQAVRGRQLRRLSRDPPRGGAVRPRARRVHRSGEEARGTLQGRARRNAAPRRGGGHPALGAEQAAARPGGKHLRAAGHQPDRDRGRAHPFGHPPQPEGNGRKAPFPRRPLLPAQDPGDPGSRAEGARRRPAAVA